MGLSGLDIVFIVIISFSALRTGLRGFVKELMSMAAILLGIAAAVVFYGVAAERIGPQIGLEGTWAQIVAFLSIFVVVYILVKLFESALNKIIERIHLEGLDHALGFLLGIVEGVLGVFLILMVLQWQTVIELDSAISDSFFAGVLLPFMPYARQIMSIRP